MTDTKQLTLEPCPFCGQAPIHFGSGEGGRGLMIECQTPGCVNPHVSYYDHDSAINAWNRRSGLARQERVVVGVTPNVAAGLIEAAFREGFAWCQQDDFDIESGWDDSQAKADADAARRR